MYPKAFNEASTYEPLKVEKKHFFSDRTEVKYALACMDLTKKGLYLRLNEFH